MGVGTHRNIQRSLVFGVGLKGKKDFIVCRPEMRGSREFGDIVWMRVRIERMARIVAIIFKRTCDSPLTSS